MTTFILTMTISFVMLLVTGMIVNFCKRRQSSTRHGLTGMCHETGGTMCSSCSSRLREFSEKSSRQITCREAE